MLHDTTHRISVHVSTMCMDRDPSICSIIMCRLTVKTNAHTDILVNYSGRLHSWLRTLSVRSDRSHVNLITHYPSYSLFALCFVLEIRLARQKSMPGKLVQGISGAMK